MKRNYVFEERISMPLCCIKDNQYYDYSANMVITNEDFINFIKESLIKKTMKIKSMELIIYEIRERSIIQLKLEDDLNFRDKIIGYNYLINGRCYFLDTRKKTFSSNMQNHIKEKIMTGQYRQVKIWE